MARSIVAVDVETTGLSGQDRIVSLAAVRLDLGPAAGAHAPVAYRYWIFNPGRESHPRAAAVHGFGGGMLRLQDPFSSHAADVHAFLTEADAICAHNAAFDSRFINSALEDCGYPALKPFVCTMQLARQLGDDEPATLDACAKRMGLPPRGQVHSALEDALLAGRFYAHLQGARLNIDLKAYAGIKPGNLRGGP